MTVDEFSNELDILLNKSNIELDEYEKSLLLTQAQLDLVNKYVTQDFESNSKVRTDLQELIKNYASEDIISSSNGISSDSKFFKLPADVLVIIQEQCTITSTDDCLNNSTIPVVPKTHDEYNKQIKNPFKKPDSSLVWRLDFHKQNFIDSNVELISPYTISKYTVRYISYPEPIVLTNLSNSVSGEGLSIDGVSTFQTSKLNESIHKEILNRANELAMSSYRENNLAK